MVVAVFPSVRMRSARVWLVPTCDCVEVGQSAKGIPVFIGSNSVRPSLGQLNQNLGVRGQSRHLYGAKDLIQQRRRYPLGQKKVLPLSSYFAKSDMKQ